MPHRGNGAAQSEGDGRYVDLTLGVLAGEASTQQVDHPLESAPTGSADLPWSHPPTEATQRAVADQTYYELPAIKQPVWEWAIPTYFWLGGAAGAAATLGAAAQCLIGAGQRPFVQRCRWIGALGTSAGTACLIYDLGRPERFLNMLRVFRPTSPMNVGSWILSASASSVATAALFGNRSGTGRKLADVAGVIAGVLGGPLAGYTGVLLASTAVPVWQGARRGLPVFFTASGMASAASLLEILPTTAAEERLVRRIAVIGKAAELAGAVALEAEAGRVREVVEPLKRGLSGTLWKAGQLLSAGSLALSLLPRRARAARIVAGLLGTAGALSLRFAMLQAGRVSARDPRATFRQQRARAIADCRFEVADLEPHTQSAIHNQSTVA